MQTDREMLELAAKAAGYALDVDGDRLDVREPGGAPMRWNPLTDDGDRYRLAKACKLMVSFDHQLARAYIDNEPKDFFFRDHGEEIAIVRAAAALAGSGEGL